MGAGAGTWAAAWPSCRRVASASSGTGPARTPPLTGSSPISWPGGSGRRHPTMASSRELKIGLLVLAALAALATELLVIGDRSNLFVRRTRYFIRLANADGLANGRRGRRDARHLRAL